MFIRPGCHKTFRFQAQNSNHLPSSTFIYLNQEYGFDIYTVFTKLRTLHSPLTITVSTEKAIRLQILFQQQRKKIAQSNRVLNSVNIYIQLQS